MTRPAPPSPFASLFNSNRITIGEGHDVLADDLSDALNSGHLTENNETFLADMIEKLAKHKAASTFTQKQLKYINDCLRKASLETWDWEDLG